MMLNHRYKFPNSFALLFLIFFITSLLTIQAQNSGSIQGVIADKTTGEVLIGTNVYLEGTGFGAASNVDGRYIINNIPPGKYILKASYLGYQERIIDIEIV